jgi:spore germination protein YaaH
MKAFHLAIVLACIVVSFAKKDVLVWMGLERTHEDIRKCLDMIRAHKDIITKVSFEKYDLGWNSTLTLNNFTDVYPEIKSMGMETYPMITTVNIQKISQVTTNPKSFIDAAVATALKYDYTGFDIDFEPEVKTGELAKPYAEFLTQFANALHAHGKKLSVDIASWTPFWSFEELAKTTVDRIHTMDTYATKLDTFKTRLEKALSYFKLHQLGVGLDWIDPNFTEEEVKARFDLIKQHNIEELALWEMPPRNEFYWKYVTDFSQN